jgi:mono/diheme cytochrome c family protein
MTKKGKVTKKDKTRLTLALGFLALSACEPSMNHEAKEHPFEPSNFFADGALARQPVDETVDREVRRITPPAMNMGLLKRGQSRFTIYCAPCHGDGASGNGMIVQHGFLTPPVLYNDDLRAKPAQFLFDVITNGYGAMYSYADRLTPEDRWAVVSYIRALQLSQHFSYDDLTDGEKRKLGEK